MEHPGGVQTWQVTAAVFFSSAEKSPRKSAMIFPAKKHLFSYGFSMFVPYFMAVISQSRWNIPPLPLMGFLHISPGERGNEAHHCRLQRPGDLQRESEGWWRLVAAGGGWQSLDLCWGPVLGHQDISYQATIATFIQVHPKDIFPTRYSYYR